MASGRSTTLSSERKISTLAASFSITASTTRSRSAKDSSSVVNVSLPSAASASDSASLPLRTARWSDFSIRARPASSAA